MVAGIRLKVCGITTLVDAALADAAGADYLGFILHPASPRHVSLEQFRDMAGRLPPRRKVAVCVSPSVEELARIAGAGFDFFQVHFPAETADGTIAAWGAAVGHDRLWLAPKRPPDMPFPERLLGRAAAILWDTYSAESHGGTGRIGDWAGFRACREAHPAATWILAGGLSPENVGDALRATGARFLDVNSGVEASPGVKDPKRLQAFFERVRESAG